MATDLCKGTIAVSPCIREYYILMASIIEEEPAVELLSPSLKLMNIELMTNVQSEIATLSFQSLLLEEFFLEPNLRREFGIPEKISELGLRFSDQAAKTLHLLILGKTSLPMSPDIIKEVISWLVAPQNTTLIFRSIADVLAMTRSAQDKYNSCYRSAICHANVGSYGFAFGALRISASINDSWARHHHIYGLIHGIENRQAQAKYELEMAHTREPYPQTRARIAQALELLS